MDGVSNDGGLFGRSLSDRPNDFGVISTPGALQIQTRGAVRIKTRSFDLRFLPFSASWPHPSSSSSSSSSTSLVRRPCKSRRLLLSSRHVQLQPKHRQHRFRIWWNTHPKPATNLWSLRFRNRSLWLDKHHKRYTKPPSSSSPF